jgi:hypothetical protein
LSEAQHAQADALLKDLPTLESAIFGNRSDIDLKKAQPKDISEAIEAHAGPNPLDIVKADSQAFHTTITDFQTQLAVLREQRLIGRGEGGAADVTAIKLVTEGKFDELLKEKKPQADEIEKDVPGARRVLTSNAELGESLNEGKIKLAAKTFDTVAGGLDNLKGGAESGGNWLANFLADIGKTGISLGGLADAAVLATAALKLLKGAAPAAPAALETAAPLAVPAAISTVAVAPFAALAAGAVGGAVLDQNTTDRSFFGDETLAQQFHRAATAPKGETSKEFLARLEKADADAALATAAAPAKRTLPPLPPVGGDKGDVPGVEIVPHARDVDDALGKLAGSANDAASALGVLIVPHARDAAPASDAKVPAYADGGPVKGPGTGTSDSIFARLSRGEYVVKADGSNLPDAWQHFKGYADGGVVDAFSFADHYSAGAYTSKSGGSSASSGLIQVDLRTNAGDFKVLADQDVVDALGRVARDRELASGGTKPSSYR